jgi:ubiquinone biosynthesis accessory factor UbiJ
MDALDAVLRPIATVLNRNIDESTPARELAAQLDGRTIGIRVRDSALAMYFTIDSGVVALHAECAAEPDVVVTGPLLKLARMAGKGGDRAIRDGSLQLTGSARTAKAFQALLGHARPDPEEALSRLVGDTASHRLGNIARGVRDWARASRSTLTANVREYLQEESRDLPSRQEVEHFSRQLDTLRDDVDRAAARLDRLDGGQ